MYKVFPNAVWVKNNSQSLIPYPGVVFHFIHMIRNIRLNVSFSTWRAQIHPQQKHQQQQTFFVKPTNVGDELINPKSGQYPDDSHRMMSQQRFFYYICAAFRPGGKIGTSRKMHWWSHPHITVWLIHLFYRSNIVLENIDTIHFSWR